MMTRGIASVLALILCSAATSFAEDRPPRSLRASGEREVARLASEWAAKVVAVEQSASVAVPVPQARQANDWGAVQALAPGTRVRVRSVRGPWVTGKVISVSDTGLATDRGTFLRDEIIEINRARPSQSLNVVSYMGLGALVGGVAGYLAGSASYDCQDCGEQRLATAMGSIGGLFLGGMGGVIVGEVVHHLPERTIYRRTGP
jgi:uncharacterized protein YcfJ